MSGFPVEQTDAVSQFLVVYLDSIDERLLDYLDEDDELRPEVVKRLRYYATALLDGSITPAAVAEDWADWVDLTQAFVAAYAPEDIDELEQAAPLMSDEVGADTVLTEADRAYLAAVELLLDAYPEMRLGSSPTRRGTPCPRRRPGRRRRGGGSGSSWRCWHGREGAGRRGCRRPGAAGSWRRSGASGGGSGAR